MLELLQGSDHVIQKDQEMSPAEERALRAMDVEKVGRICWNCYKGSDHVIQKDQEMSPAEERALRALDVEEVGRICWNCYKVVIM